MTDKKTNRVFDEQPGDKKPAGKPEQVKVNIQGAVFSFNVQPQGDKFLVQTPMGMVTLPAASADQIAELNQNMAKILSGGVTPDAIKRIQELVMAFPPVQELLAQLPQFQTLMNQAVHAMQVQPKGAVPKKKPAKPVIASPQFKPQGLTFARFYNTQYPN